MTIIGFLQHRFIPQLYNVRYPLTILWVLGIDHSVGAPGYQAVSTTPTWYEDHAGPNAACLAKYSYALFGTSHQLHQDRYIEIA